VDALELDLVELRRAVDHREALVAVHYACAPFSQAKAEPAAVSCIAIHDLQTGDTLAFSRSDAPPAVEDPNREIHLLERFFGELTARSEAHFLHWNMNRPEYGFNALIARYEYLTAKTPEVQLPNRRTDVDDLLSAEFGADYAPHPKLEHVARLNNLDTRSFKSGRVEGELFEKSDWGQITRSTSSKVIIIANLLKLLVRGTIRTAGSVGSVLFAGSRIDAVSLVLALGDKLLLVQRSLKKHPHGGAGLTFETEYDDQYIFKALLVQFFEDVRGEDYVPSSAGGNSRVDFVLPDHRLGIELKKASANLGDKELGEQLATDQVRYAPHPKIDHLICLVFDRDGHISNPRALENDLRTDSSSPELAVTVRIYDR
jgi:hypothetical protein